MSSLLQKRRGELTRKFLELIDEYAGNLQDHLMGFLRAGYGASMEGAEYEARQYSRSREKRAIRPEQKRQFRQRYYLMISRLKKDGLITKKYKNGKETLSVTLKGYRKLQQFVRGIEQQFPIPDYKMNNGSAFIFVVFDIPERDRRKRAWLRAVLKNLSFKMIQQSVWMGRGALPKAFLKDLKKMRLLDFVEIFEASKLGTIR